jgi:hypothetical protein
MASQINYGLVNPNVLDYAGQEQKALNVQKTKMDVERLENERKIMLDFQKQLADNGKNTDLNFVFDTMIKTGNPDYVAKGLEGKSKLQEQREFARVMGYEMAPPAAPSGGAPISARPPVTPMGAPVAPTNVLASTASAPSAPTMPVNALAPQPVLDEANKLKQQINGLLAIGNPQAIQAAQVLQSRLSSMQKPQLMTVGKEGAVFDPATKQFYTPPRPAGGVGGIEPPKLKQGERWNAQKERVEAVPGSDIYTKQRSAFTQDYKTATSVTDKMDEGIKKIDQILDPKNTTAFEGNFGGYNALATRLLPGENTDLRKKIDSFKSTLKSAGLELIRAGGAIGQMTVQEWPIVEQMIDAITPELSEDEAKRSFNEIRSRFERITNRAKDVYETEYADSQFYKPIKSMMGATPSASSNTVTIPNGKTLTFPTAEAAAAYKKAAGL